MNPVCFHIGSRPVYWYGVMVALGFLAAIVHWSLLGRRENRPKGFGSDLAFWLMIGGILGARAAYVLANWSVFAADPASILRIDQGGLIFYGGFIGGAVALILLARVRREPLWSLADFTITALPLGHAFGRIGCFLNGCCYGKACDAALCLWSHDARRIPTQLFEVGANVAIYLILLRAYRHRTVDGRTTALYFMLYPAFRFFNEFLRGDARMRVAGLDGAQVVSLVLLAAGVALWMARRPRTLTPSA